VLTCSVIFPFTINYALTGSTPENTITIFILTDKFLHEIVTLNMHYINQHEDYLTFSQSYYFIGWTQN